MAFWTTFERIFFRTTKWPSKDDHIPQFNSKLELFYWVIILLRNYLGFPNSFWVMMLWQSNLESNDVFTQNFMSWDKISKAISDEYLVFTVLWSWNKYNFVISINREWKKLKKILVSISVLISVLFLIRYFIFSLVLAWF